MSIALLPNGTLSPSLVPGAWYGSVSQHYLPSTSIPYNSMTYEDSVNQNMEQSQFSPSWRNSNHLNIISEWSNEKYPSNDCNCADTYFNHVLKRSQHATEFRSDLLSSKTSQLWRPFSPSPTRQYARQSSEALKSIDEKTRRFSTRITFHSITPSNVKIGPSKTSVFKAVKKKSYSCPQCFSRYISVAQLTSHMRVHTGFKPYACEYSNCSKTFARNEELTRHRRIHSGYKPHLCSVCDKRFGRKDHLSKHLKTHLQVSEKKVYVCSESGCGHRYTRSDALTRHKSTAHRIKKAKLK